MKYMPFEDGRKNNVERYDALLEFNIQLLEEHISEEEESTIQFMRSIGDREEVIQALVDEGRREGAPISIQFGSSKHLFDHIGVGWQ